MYWKVPFKLCSKCDREPGFDVILGQAVFCHKLRWICHKHSSDVPQQVETPSKRTIFVAEQIYLVTQHNFHVASVVMLYHDCTTSKCCNRCIFSLTTCELLRRVASYCAAFVWYIIEHFFHGNIISMFYYILNIKMTSQSLSNFTELQAYGS